MIIRKSIMAMFAAVAFLASLLVVAEAAGKLGGGPLVQAEAVGVIVLAVAGAYLVGRIPKDSAETVEKFKESESRFRALSEEFRAILDAIPDNLAMQSRDYRIVWTNAVTAATLGRNPDELPGKYCYEMWQGRAEPCEPCPMKTVLETGRFERVVTTMPNGTIWEARAVPVRDAEGRVDRVVELVRDITDIRRLEDQLRAVQKMEAVGRLAGGIAHDINNYLGAITGYSEHLLMTRGKDPELTVRLEGITAIAAKASSLIRQLLAFSRQQPMRVDVLNLNALLEKMVPMLRGLLGERITLEMRLGDGLWNVQADSLQVEQVIMNLAVNAKDAMPDTGRLTVATANATLTEEDVAAHPVMKPGRYARVTVADTGTGIPPEIREKIFEPFFTTKETGRGSGLGLATVYGTVKQHKGYVWVDSAVGSGTAFEIYLPMSEEEVSAAAFSPASPDENVHGAGRILLAEDHADVRAAFQAMLDAMGYRVTTASNGEEAVRLVRQRPKEFDLLLTDVVMPKMGGKEAASRIRKIDGDIKVLFISGYTDHAICQDGLLKEGVNFLQKPFTSKVLGKKISELLSPCHPAA